MLHRDRSVIGYAASVPDETGLTTPSLHQLMPFARTLGIELLAATPDQVHCRLRWSEGLEGAGVGLHGGAIMGLADTGGGICAALNLPAGATGTTTIESKTNFLRAIRSGTIEAVSRPLHKGRSVIVVETDVTDAEHRLAARVTQSQIVLRGGG
jgi:1,4-dihydroxy-2-naphthoyl-CoA hydrolase